jgi:hypothetical protein
MPGMGWRPGSVIEIIVNRAICEPRKLGRPVGPPFAYERRPDGPASGVPADAGIAPVLARALQKLERRTFSVATSNHSSAGELGG